MAIFPWVIQIQFLSTHFCTVFGDGHKPVNFPTNPRSAKAIADFLGRGGRETSRISSNFFMNLEMEGRGLAAAFPGIRAAKRSAWFSGSGGRGVFLAIQDWEASAGSRRDQQKRRRLAGAEAARGVGCSLPGRTADQSRRVQGDGSGQGVQSARAGIRDPLPS